MSDSLGVEQAQAPVKRKKEHAGWMGGILAVKMAWMMGYVNN